MAMDRLASMICWQWSPHGGHAWAAQAFARPTLTALARSRWMTCCWRSRTGIRSGLEVEAMLRHRQHAAEAGGDALQVVLQSLRFARQRLREGSKPGRGCDDRLRDRRSAAI